MGFPSDGGIEPNGKSYLLKVMEKAIENTIIFILKNKYSFTLQNRQLQFLRFTFAWTRPIIISLHARH
ncbi:hypothetical protein PanWU01x14_116390 [Parasponia andersonii]|uniref:Uncharacterized protein n=1 Tax=Parasponia andersonii TaxID=3476 RepID=A0A2P5CWS5_PARAD|nr:hypothetical protein PanWU01x14_116390 [Parasponia andersonii]